MLKEMSFSGHWKFPKDEQWRLSGDLTFSPTRGVRLKLLGSLRTEQNSIKARNYYDIIQGISIGGKRITLIDCVVDENSSIPGIPESIVGARYMIAGIHFDELSEIGFNALSVHFQNLDDWVAVSGFSGNVVKEFERFNKEKEIRINYKQPASIELYNDEKKKILLFFSVNSPVFGYFIKEQNITQKLFINVTFKERVSLVEVMTILKMCRNFFNFGLARLTIETKLTGYQHIEDDKESKFDIYYSHKYIPPQKENLFDYTMLFSMNHLELSTKEVFTKWMDRYSEYFALYNLYFDTIYNLDLDDQNRFLNYCFAIETYHRKTGVNYLYEEKEYNKLKEVLINSTPKGYIKFIRDKLAYGNEPSFRKRLNSLFETFDEIFSDFIPDKKTYINRVVTTRNNFVHLTSSSKKHMIPNDKLFFYNISLSILLQICLLHEIGFLKEQIKAAIARPDFNSSIITEKDWFE